MRTLAPETWLEDEVINYYLQECLARRDEELCLNQQGRRQSHCFNTFFLSNLFSGKSNKYNYANVREWSKKVPGGDIFDLKYILCPLQL